MINIIKLITKFYHNLSIIWKFNIIYFVIIVIPISIVGIFIFSTSFRMVLVQNQNYIDQELLQIRENINIKVGTAEEFAKNLIYNKKITEFLEKAYLENSSNILNYNTEIMPFIDDLFILNNPIYYCMRIYYKNLTIPEAWDYFYKIDRIKNKKLILEFMTDKRLLLFWEKTHEDNINKENNRHVFSIYAKINSSSFKDQLGILELGIREDVLLESLRKSNIGQKGQIFVTDRQFNIISNTYPEMFMKNLKELYNLDENLIKNSNQTLMKINNIDRIVTIKNIEKLDCLLVSVISISSYSKTIRYTKRLTFMVLTCIFIILFILIYIINSKLLSRLKLLVKAMKLVQDGNLAATVNTEMNDEIGTLSSNYNSMIIKINELIETNYKSNLAEKEAELKALEAQINPHFLYNTLSTISWAAKIYKNYKVVDITNTLAKFYRYIMDNRKLIVTIREELEHLELYLKIQNTRYLGILDIVFNIQETVYEYTVLKLILQPIVENAIIHGIGPKMTHGTLIVKVREEESQILFEIIDDGVGISYDIMEDINNNRTIKSKFGGYAIKNVNDRIRIYYGEKYHLTMYSKRGIGTSVSIRIPKIKD